MAETIFAANVLGRHTHTHCGSGGAEQKTVEVADLALTFDC
ncbi:hypothetical protein OH492_12510 [Vibrio chagasii]|nr:hypothetical protein [Vibrio chagasii]